MVLDDVATTGPVYDVQVSSGTVEAGNVVEASLKEHTIATELPRCIILYSKEKVYV